MTGPGMCGTIRRIKATNVKVRDTVLTWYGPRIVHTIEPYIGTLPAVGVARFTDDTGMTFFDGDVWDIVVIP